MFKKTFATITAMLMIAAIFPTQVLGSATYGAELEGAYAYAADKGITTMDTIDSANMYGSLIRIHLAKMMSEYAQDVLDMEADTSKDCSFVDL